LKTKEHIFSALKKAGVVVVNSEVVELAPGVFDINFGPKIRNIIYKFFNLLLLFFHLLELFNEPSKGRAP
jgi:hypothetical protein